MKRVIRLGDPTSHGGSVTSAAENFSIMDIAVAREGDSVSCPRPGHSGCTIAQGDPTWIIEGRAVALETHVTSCGAELMSTLPNVERG